MKPLWFQPRIRSKHLVRDLLHRNKLVFLYISINITVFQTVMLKLHKISKAQTSGYIVVAYMCSCDNQLSHLKSFQNPMYSNNLPSQK
ncbi:hypothetical protein GDO78_003591 [Eleutherodactylus coqui]|uniref:Uncharacterized protein n=1 Tax=Eleutherodactylus coqui TaxID=57060 RepID=A0A8J6EUG3_ELECQ|nr:hypothetical protein GDO78_003591 [Eleutherodactylus coqui]